MSLSARATILVVAAVVCGAVRAEEAPIRVGLCELIAAPERFNGKMVQVRATMRSGFEWGGLVEGDCALMLDGDRFPALEGGAREFAYMKRGVRPEEIAAAEWKPIQLPPRVQFVKDEAYEEFGRFVYQKWRRVDGSECFECPLYSVTVTVTGRFDHFPTGMIAVRSSGDKPVRTILGGFGHLSRSSQRLVWRSVSDVVATPVDWTVYEGNAEGGRKR